MKKWLFYNLICQIGKDCSKKICLKVRNRFFITNLVNFLEFFAENEELIYFSGENDSFEDHSLVSKIKALKSKNTQILSKLVFYRLHYLELRIKKSSDGDFERIKL
jgi:hypothetical protein